MGEAEAYGHFEVACPVIKKNVLLLLQLALAKSGDCGGSLSRTKAFLAGCYRAYRSYYSTGKREKKQVIILHCYLMFMLELIAGVMELQGLFYLIKNIFISEVPSKIMHEF